MSQKPHPMQINPVGYRSMMTTYSYRKLPLGNCNDEIHTVFERMSKGHLITIPENMQCKDHSSFTIILIVRKRQGQLSH